MIYNAEIEVKEDPEVLERVFSAEKFKKEERSRFTIKKEKSKLIFFVEANDSVALRATLNSITKLLKIYEDLKSIK